MCFITVSLTWKINFCLPVFFYLFWKVFPCCELWRAERNGTLPRPISLAGPALERNQAHVGCGTQWLAPELGLRGPQNRPSQSKQRSPPPQVLQFSRSGYTTLTLTDKVGPRSPCPTRHSLAPGASSGQAGTRTSRSRRWLRPSNRSRRPMATGRRLGGVDPFRQPRLPLPLPPSPRARASSAPAPAKPTYSRWPGRRRAGLSTQTTNGAPHKRGPRLCAPRFRPRHGAIPTLPLPSREYLCLGCWLRGPAAPTRIIFVARLLWPSDATPLNLQVWSRSTQCTASSLQGPVARRRSRFSTLMTTAYKYEATTSVLISLVFLFCACVPFSLGWCIWAWYWY